MRFSIQGRVAEREDGLCRRFPTLSVVAYDTEEGKILASAATDDEGAYKLEYEQPAPHDVLLGVTLALDVTPTTVAVARTTAGKAVFLAEDMVTANEWRVDPENKELLRATKDIFVDCCCLIWAVRGYYTILGTVIDAETLVPLGGVTVEAQDWDPSGAHDFLGSAVTDGSGRFTIHARVADFITEDVGAGWRPDLRFRVSRIDPSGNREVCLDFDDDRIRMNWPNCKPVEIPVRCCMAIIKTVGGWYAHLAPGPRGIDSEGYAQGANASGFYGGTPGNPEVHNAPFGGTVILCGETHCKNVDRYQYSVAKWSDDTTPPAEADYVPLRPGWSEGVELGYICYPDPPYGFACDPIKGVVNQVADGDGFYPILFNTESPCKLYMPWYTSGTTPPFDDGKYSVRLTVKNSITGAIFRSRPVQVRIDNCRPKAELSLDVFAPCADIIVGDVVTGKFTARDRDSSDDPKCVKAHFHGYTLNFEGNAASGVIRSHHETDPALNGVVNEAFSWDTTGLTPCGYRIYLWVWDRSIINGVPSAPPHGNVDFKQIYFCLRPKATETPQ